MTTIYISHALEDRDYVDQLVPLLEKSGQRLRYFRNFNAVSGMVESISEQLDDADVFLVVVSSSSMKSANVMMELGRAKVQAEAGDKVVMPLLIEDIPLSGVFRKWGVVFAYGKSIEEIAGRITSEISSFEEARRSKKVQARVVEEDLSRFVDATIETQRASESLNRRTAYGWYATGAIALGAGLAWTANLLAYAVKPDFTPDLTKMISMGLSNIIAIGFLGALGKYGFALGKSYMGESLKSSDRIHAIQFGQFYLRAFGSRLTPAEVRDAFQHWNIDRDTSFSPLNSAEIDPQVLAVVGQIVAGLAAKKDEKG